MSEMKRVASTSPSPSPSREDENKRARHNIEKFLGRFNAEEERQFEELAALSDEALDEKFERARAAIGNDEIFERIVKMAAEGKLEPPKPKTEKELKRELVDARKEFMELKRKDDKIDKLKEDIDAQIRKLQEKRAKVMRAKQRFREGPLEDALIPYCEASCILLATRMHARLPRELRDQIYAHIWTPSYIWDNVTPIVSTFQGHEPEVVPHVLDACFVGDDVALEMLEAFYRIERLPIEPFDCFDPYDVERLVHDDCFCVGIEPAKHLRQMKIELNMDDLGWGDPEVSGDCGKMEMSDIKECLHSLLEIEKKKGFRLGIKLSQRRVRLNDWPKWFDILKPILEAFEKEGGLVKIIWSYRGSEWAEYKVRKNLRDLVRKYGTPEWNSDWKTAIKSDLDAERRIRDHHREYLLEDTAGYDEEDFHTDEESDDGMSDDSGQFTLTAGPVNPEDIVTDAFDDWN